MARRLGQLSLLFAAASLVAAGALRRLVPAFRVDGVDLVPVAATALVAATIGFGLFGIYRLTVAFVERRARSKGSAHTVRNVLRLGFLVAGVVAVLAAVTEQWVGLFFSVGIFGFAVTFALQQPLLSLIGWAYIVVKHPYGAGDRVRIEDAKGDVVDVDYLVTTLWEINGELVSSNQPSGRLVTVPNSVVLSKEVYNYSWEQFPYVWNELTVQVAYETDLPFARELMRSVADDYLGDEMAEAMARYRRVLDRTPVELEVRDRPTVNVRQGDSWVELTLRYLVRPREGTTVRNELYERVLTEFNEHPNRVCFPVGRNR